MGHSEGENRARASVYPTIAKIACVAAVLSVAYINSAVCKFASQSAPLYNN